MGGVIGLSHGHKAAELVFCTIRFLLPRWLCCELHSCQRFQRRSILHIWKVWLLPLICCVTLAGSLCLPMPTFTCLQNRSESGSCLLESVLQRIDVECHMHTSPGGTACLKMCSFGFFWRYVFCATCLFNSFLSLNKSSKQVLKDLLYALKIM